MVEKQRKSRGHSQQRILSGRSLQKCKDKKQVDNVIIIDVDQCNSDNVVTIDGPESSRQKKKGVGELKKSYLWPSAGVISIDDEGVNANSSRNGDGGGDLDSDATSSNKVHPASSKLHPSPEVSDDIDCEIFEEGNDFHFKMPECMRRVAGKERHSRNCFGLFSEDESSSDSDDSDCEIMEDFSGCIREQWEKAALRRNGRSRIFGLDDEVSASGSTTDTRNVSQEMIPEDIDKENNEDCTQCFSLEQCANAPFASSRSDVRSGKDKLCTCSITSVPGGKRLVSNLDRLADEINNQNTGSQDEDDHILEEPNMCTSEPGEDAVFGDSGISSLDIEKPLSGDCSFNDATLHDETCFHQTSTGLTNNSEPAAGVIPDMHIERESLQDETESASGDPSSCGPHFQHEAQFNYETGTFWENAEPYPEEASPDSESLFQGGKEASKEDLGSKDKEEQNTIESASGDPSSCGSHFQHEAQANHETATSWGSAKSYPEEASPDSGSLFQGRKDASKEDVGLNDKEEQYNMVPPPRNAQVHHSLVGCESTSFCDRVRTPDGNSSGQQCNQTQLTDGKNGINNGEKISLESPSCNSQQQEESDRDVLENLIGEREKHKETDEYKRALEDEWNSRRRELQIQAEEAQRLRKRKKAENMRLLEMERRQRQRLEEVRETQKKDEEIIHLKEKIRAEIRRELEVLELRFTDLASLLRGIGIHVKGDHFPTEREVNAAYKQALLKFHPDRASSSDVRQQVEAEEMFKLISRSKEKLLPVGNMGVGVVFGGI